MDPLSIASGCAGLVTAIGSLSFSIHTFVRTCREARSDLDRVSRELHSLQTVLELIQEDAADEAKPFPPTLGQHVSGIVSNCTAVVVEVQSCITKYGDGRLRSKMSWTVNGQGDMEKLRTSLEAHKSALELALDMLTLSLTKEIKTDTTEIRNDTAAIKDDTAQILQEIARLQARLPEDAATPNDFMLQKFLEEMTTYTEQELDTTLVDGDSRRNSRALSFIGEQDEAAPTRTSPRDPSWNSWQEQRAVSPQPASTTCRRNPSPWDNHQEAAVPPLTEPSSNPSPWTNRQEVGIPHSEASRTSPTNTSSWSNRYQVPVPHQEPSRAAPTNASPWSNYQEPPRPSPTNHSPQNSRPRPPTPPGKVPLSNPYQPPFERPSAPRPNPGEYAEYNASMLNSQELRPPPSPIPAQHGPPQASQFGQYNPPPAFPRAISDPIPHATTAKQRPLGMYQPQSSSLYPQTALPYPESAGDEHEQRDHGHAASDITETLASRLNDTHMTPRYDTTGAVMDLPTSTNSRPRYPEENLQATDEADVLRSGNPGQTQNDWVALDTCAAMAYRGNLVLDCPVPQDLLDSIPHNDERNEFTHWRFTAATCYPQDFVDRNYTIRPQLFARPRLIQTVLSFRLDPAETMSEFVTRWHFIVRSVNHLCENFTADSWKSVVYTTQICPVIEVDGTTGVLQPGSSKSPSPIQTIATALVQKERTFRVEAVPRWVHHDWMNAVGEMLEPEGLFLIDMTSMDGVDFGEKSFIWDLWLNTRPLKAEPGSRTYLLRVIELGNLLKQLNDMKPKSLRKSAVNLARRFLT